jgi:hypothetical protein
VRRHPLFCLRKSYWGFGGSRQAEEELHNSPLHLIANPKGVELSEVPEDVQQEYRRVVEEKEEEEAVTVRIVRLHKRFGSFSAVRSLSLGINKNECFGLLVRFYLSLVLTISRS